MPRAEGFYDPADPGVVANPYRAFEALRRHGTPVWVESVRGYMVTHHQHVSDGLRDPRFSSNRIRPFFERLAPADRTRFAALEASIESWSIFEDPPDHTRLRLAFAHAFSGRKMRELQEAIGRIVDGILEPLRGTAEMDFVEHVAYPIPAVIICTILGADIADIASLRTWSEDIARFIGLPQKSIADFEAAARSNAALVEYFRVLLAARRKEPRDDLISGLAEACDQKALLTEDELYACCNLLLFAAHTTTTHLIGNGILALSRNPAESEKLFQGRVPVATAVEELLRYDGPVHAVRRVPLEDMELGGVPLAKGDLVFMMITAANRDPAAFADPEALDLSRTPNRHLSFGAGIHFCIGAQLARIEGMVAFEKFISAMKSVEAQEDSGLSWSKSFGFRGLEKLPVRIQWK